LNLRRTLRNPEKAKSQQQHPLGLNHDSKQELLSPPHRQNLRRIPNQHLNLRNLLTKKSLRLLALNLDLKQG
jgi:hypothetical protein